MLRYNLLEVEEEARGISCCDINFLVFFLRYRCAKLGITLLYDHWLKRLS